MAPNPNAGVMNLFFLVSIFAIWYVLLIRPQQKKQKEHQLMIENLKKNEAVVTTGGIHGVVVNVKEKTFVLRVDDNSKIEVDKLAIGYVIKKKEG